jgi:hypothetical protein
MRRPRSNTIKRQLSRTAESGAAFGADHVVAAVDLADALAALGTWPHFPALSKLL